METKGWLRLWLLRGATFKMIASRCLQGHLQGFINESWNLMKELTSFGTYQCHSPMLIDAVLTKTAFSSDTHHHWALFNENKLMSPLICSPKSDYWE